VHRGEGIKLVLDLLKFSFPRCSLCFIFDNTAQQEGRIKMIEGLIGMALAFVIFVLVLLFAKRKPDAKIASELNKIMKIQGFTTIDSSDPTLKPVREAFSLTAYPVYIEQAYHRTQDGLMICWVSTSSDGANNSLASVIPQKVFTGRWILLHLPSIKGAVLNIIQKGYEKIILSRGFNKVKGELLPSSMVEFNLYLQDGDSIPRFTEEIIHFIRNSGNLVIRSTGSSLIIERISITRSETWEREASEILRISQSIKGLISLLSTINLSKEA
jgi:hypothetical protein